MGRYYNGDIKGKFWVGVQSSDDASFFGLEEHGPSVINYYGNEDHLEEIKNGLKVCQEELGEYKEKMDKFFEDNNGYNNKMLADYLEISEIEVPQLLKWYARFKLGDKIKKCIEGTGHCDFNAEL